MNSVYFRDVCAYLLFSFLLSINLVCTADVLFVYFAVFKVIQN